MRSARRLAKGLTLHFATLLEVASAAGFFLAEVKAAGFDAAGVEFSNPMAAYARVNSVRIDFKGCTGQRVILS